VSRPCGDGDVFSTPWSSISGGTSGLEDQVPRREFSNAATDDDGFRCAFYVLKCALAHHAASGSMGSGYDFMFMRTSVHEDQSVSFGFHQCTKIRARTTKRTRAAAFRTMRELGKLNHPLTIHHAALGCLSAPLPLKEETSTFTSGSPVCPNRGRTLMRILFFGGCHVVGAPVGQELGFVAKPHAA